MAICVRKLPMVGAETHNVSSSPSTASLMHGGGLLIEALRAHGATLAFCVPGESFLAALDGLYDVQSNVRLITCRQEGGAAMMAEAHGKLTGRPGVCFVTRGPGATNASIGVHVARQDSTPMLLFVGQVARGDRGREAFQEIDHARVFAGIAKAAVEIDRTDRIEEIVHWAHNVALQGRPGPVVLALPEDMLAEAAPALAVARPASVARPALDPAARAEIVAALEAAERPLLVLGGSVWRSEELAAIQTAAEAKSLPIALSWRRKDLIDNRSPSFVGDLGLGANPALLARVRDADLVIVAGARLGENATQGYTLFTPAQTAEKLVHLYPEAEELGRVWPCRIAAACAPGALADILTAAAPRAEWAAWTASARADFDAFSQPVDTLGAVNPARLFAALRACLPEDAIVANGAGNYAVWLHRYFPHYRRFCFLASTSGAMGYGLPAAIAAKATWPDREVVSVSGDGCFLMNGQELATAAQHGLGIVALVLDNGGYGTIRMHQERHYPGRPIGTALANPDFAAYARAFGAWGALVEADGDFAPALAEARARAQAGQPALIHVRTDMRDIAPGRTL